jgi:predicted phage baseplate assembly protein
VFRETFDLGELVPRNPLPAVGGTAPEPVAEVKLFAPHAFRARLERAITADDYAALAADNARRLSERAASHGADCADPFRRLQAAKGALRWTGSWYEAAVTVDPLGAEAAEAQLFAEIDAYLERYRRVGHDLHATLARFVPIDLALTVCVLPHVLRGHVEAGLIAAFSNRVLPDGRLGFFHPDNLTFGSGIFLSRIIAVAQVVPGVMEVEVTRLARYHVGAPAPDGVSKQVPASGVLVLAPFEVARLSADPNFPDNGRFTLHMRGGR